MLANAPIKLEKPAIPVRPPLGGLLLLGLLSAACALAGAHVASAAITAAILPPESAVEPTQIFDVQLTITGAGTPFNGYDAVVAYDPTRLTFLRLTPLSLQEGALMTAACGNRFHVFNVAPDSSSVTINHVLLCAGVHVAGPGVIYKLRFQAKWQSGVTDLRFSTGTTFYDAGVELSGVSTTNATVRIGHSQVDFVPLGGSFGCDQTLAVDVAVASGVTDLRSFSFAFEFDPAIVQPVAVVPGALETGASCASSFAWINAAAVGDSIVVSGSTPTCSVNGPGSILRITFAGVGDGTSYVRCRHGSLRTSLGALIPFDCGETSVSYVCPVPQARTGWGAIKQRYRSAPMR